MKEETGHNAEERFGYFVIQARTRRGPEGRAVVTLQLENVGTGEKRTLISSGELRRFVDEWAEGGTPDQRFRPPHPPEAGGAE